MVSVGKRVVTDWDFNYNHSISYGNRCATPEEWPIWSNFPFFVQYSLKKQNIYKSFVNSLLLQYKSILDNKWHVLLIIITEQTRKEICLWAPHTFKNYCSWPGNDCHCNGMNNKQNMVFKPILEQAWNICLKWQT